MKFSILTVVKNSYPNIKLTLKSIKKQSYHNYEHIILDGLSVDGTTQFIKKNLNKKTIYLRKKDKSLYDALNKAVKLATGDYLVILHAGDFFFSSETLLDLKKNIIKNKSFDYLFSNIMYFNNNSNKICRYWKYNQKKDFFAFLKIPHTSLCIKKKVAKKLNYDLQYMISADTKYTLELYKNYSGKYINQIFTYMESGGLSTNYKFIFKKMSEDLRILYGEFKLNFIFLYFYKVIIKFENFFFIDKKFTNIFRSKKRKLIFFKNY
jgi:glycosyltransferase involved in cell wall biosynthesis